MLIYTKIVDGERHLFGTLANIPSEDDVQLTYKNADGEEVSEIDAFKFFYGTKVALFAGESDRQLPSEEDTQISVWIGDTAVLGVEEDEEEVEKEEVVEETNTTDTTNTTTDTTTTDTTATTTETTDTTDTTTTETTEEVQG